jgi:hypothetical protein
MVAGAMRRASHFFTGNPNVKSGGENGNAIDTLGNSGAEGDHILRLSARTLGAPQRFKETAGSNHRSAADEITTSI